MGRSFPISEIVVAVGLMGLAGCGGPSLYPVRGKVVWENGTAARELAGGMVIAESIDRKVGAQGEIDKEGSFRLSTTKPGDGLLVGKYRVAVVEHRQGEPLPPSIVDGTFSKLDDKGLAITVEPKTNEVTLQIRRAKPR